MRRGFKAWCEQVSAEYHQELGVSLTQAFDPRLLAEKMGVRVLLPSDIRGLSPASLKQLTVVDAESWSAITLVRRGVKLVVLNSGQSPARRANSLAHELAHIVLNHTSDDAQLSAEGFLFRARFDKDQEDEANWLAGCILVPREGLRRAYWRTQSPQALAAHFGVSRDLINWRLRMTGIARQMGNAIAKRYARGA